MCISQVLPWEKDEWLTFDQSLYKHRDSNSLGYFLT